MINNEFERHPACDQKVAFYVEQLDETLRWTACRARDFKKGGKFIIFHPDFTEIMTNDQRLQVPELAFSSDEAALEAAKALSHVCDRPLRVQRVQTVRVQRTVGKIILPVGGI